jgi:putative endonuclease
MARHNDLGKAGEATALKFLQDAGHTILAQNYRYGRAEIDIISQERELIIFTEVKTRSNGLFGFPEDAVDKKKRRLMQLAAVEYLYQNNMKGEMRFDIISITSQSGKQEIFHIKDAFFNEEIP